MMDLSLCFTGGTEACAGRSFAVDERSSVEKADRGTQSQVSLATVVFFALKQNERYCKDKWC